ncbi:DMT family transporter [Acidovorax sp. JHL-9]|uniref:DMT family transporter n=1 Tax=Acidovorax sp. JHL-9 TaxID=1276756 RepID=UPI00047EB6CD|nr:DMT family transporter [Acidovorax sp. JHL-9]
METKKNESGFARNTSAQQGTWWLAAVTVITMLAFAANSLFTRMALRTTPIDPATFAAGRLMAGALTLAIIIGMKRQRPGVSSHGLLSATLLFVYAAAFSFAYRGMDTGAGALVLFASAQLLMIGFGYARGEKTNLWGVALALAGLIVFLSPSDAAPPLGDATLMVVAGLAWGGFSLVSRTDGSPVLGTANSFLLAAPLALTLLWLWRHELHYDPTGMLYAALSGGVTSALGYVVWYWVRVRMAAITAGTVQLSVPVLSAVLGVLVLGETLSAKSAVAAILVLLGVALTTRATRTAAQA